MSLQPWCKIIHANHRVEVDQRYVTVKEMERFANELNDLFEEHSNFKNTNAYVNYDEVPVCIFCEAPYEQMYDEERKDFVCATCGKGKLEVAIKVMAEGKEKVDENILQQF